MNRLLDMAAVFAFDVFAEARLPCIMTGFDYYTRVIIAIVGPVAMTVLIVLGALVSHPFLVRREKRRMALVGGVPRVSAIRRALRRGAHNSTWLFCRFILRCGLAPR